MPTLLELRRRTRSVRNTEQITRAMKMVATARLRRAQEAIVSARPFASGMLRVLNRVSSAANPGSHPLLQVREADRVAVIVITSDRGLCGSFNTNLLKRTEILLDSLQDRDLLLQTVGRKGREGLKRREIRRVDPMEDIFRDLGFDHARRIAGPLMRRYSGDEVEESDRLDAVHLVFNEFKNILRQDVVVEQLLPIPRLDLKPEEGGLLEFLHEPSEAEIFESLLPRHVEYQVWRALLESAAAEQAARMTAMDNASKNAKDLIDDLTLTMNRVRQAAITREILEIVSGAEALD